MSEDEIAHWTMVAREDGTLSIENGVFDGRVTISTLERRDETEEAWVFPMQIIIWKDGKKGDIWRRCLQREDVFSTERPDEDSRAGFHFITGADDK